ncbi:MAG TPA: DUF4167 domain-containing protein [Stellaceae bacterium]|nr:DUF4167 domain-containing protein [Stellaceae bacterium]
MRGRSSNNGPTQPRRAAHNNQLLDSHGPAERIRGSASQITERYLTLAREAERSDDRVSSQNYFQHAEHYLRIGKSDCDGDVAAPPPPPDQAADAAALAPTEHREAEGRAQP